MTDSREILVSEGPVNHTVMVFAGTAGGCPTSVVKILGMFLSLDSMTKTTHEERTSRVFKKYDFQENFQFFFF